MRTPHTISPADPIVYSNGVWTAQSQATVPFMDSGFWYGDGLFETILVENETMFRADKHLERMHAGMDTIRIDFPFSDDQVIDLMLELVSRSKMDCGLLRLMCTRGTVPGAPYKFDGPANVFIGLRYGVPEPALPVKALVVEEANYPIARMTPAIKSMTYIGNMLAIGDAVKAGAFEPLFINRDGLVTECAVRNIFFLKGDTLRTPSTSLGILPGVTRDLVIELSAELGLKVDDAPIHVDDINSMDEAFLSSTGIGIYPVKWDGFAPAAYPITEQLRTAVDRQIMKETGADRQSTASA